MAATHANAVDGCYTIGQMQLTDSPKLQDKLFGLKLTHLLCCLRPEDIGQFCSFVTFFWKKLNLLTHFFLQRYDNPSVTERLHGIEFLTSHDSTWAFCSLFKFPVNSLNFVVLAVHKLSFKLTTRFFPVNPQLRYRTIIRGTYQ